MDSMGQYGEHPSAAITLDNDEEAVNRMLQAAQELGANAVVNVRFSTSSVAQVTTGMSVVPPARGERTGGRLGTSSRGTM